MNTREDLIYSVWAADTTPLAERAEAVFTAISKTYPKVTCWTATHKNVRYKDSFQVNAPYNENPSLREGYDAVKLWQQTQEHYAKLGLDNDLISGVSYSTWSDELDESIGVSFSDYQFDLDNWDSEAQEEREMPQSDRFQQLLKQLGSSSAISGVWMLNHSAFAGNPACLYEPKQLFTSYYDATKYEQVIKTVQAVRNAVNETLTANQIAEMLRQLGARVEPLGQDRLFVQFGELGSDTGELILQQLEPQITARLGRAGQLKQAAWAI